MAGEATFTQLNLVVSDMDAAVAFYRLLGVDVGLSTDDWPPGSGARHVHTVESPHGSDLDLDNQTMAAIWGDDRLRPGDAVIGFAVPGRAAVDEKHRELTAAGYRSRRAPYDAFFGARYAIVEDADGNLVGLMSPVDPQRRYVPPGS
ncbi:MAG: VOC family protein [Acidimicrobiia bacterium]